MHIFKRIYKVDKFCDRALCGNGLGLSLMKKKSLICMVAGLPSKAKRTR